MVHTGGFIITPIQKVLAIMEQIKPTSILAMDVQIKEILSLANKEQIGNLKTLIIANGCIKENRQKYLDMGYKVQMTYGFSEARMAWMSDKDMTGYYVFKDSGCTFKEDNGELVLFSRHYPDGYHTGDKSQIIKETDEYQVIGLDIARFDGVIKSEAVCLKGL
jgi:hypothetical protein